MFRQLTTAAARTSAIRPAVRITAMNYSSSEGATGSGFSRPGGQASGDSFTKREKAQEDLYMRQKEKESLAALRAKLKAQQDHLKELDDHIQEYQRHHDAKEQK